MTLSRRHLLVAGGIAGAITLPVAAAEPRRSFDDHVIGLLYGVAIGDAMGAPVEGWLPNAVAARFGEHDFGRFLPSTRADQAGSGRGKGDGRFTDDMLGLEGLVRVYAAHRDHLDAHSYARLFAKEIAEQKVWVPETQDERPPLERPLWWPERYFHNRVAIANVDPRTAGIGNRTNGGLISIVPPAGVVNAGDPDGAYAEVVAFGAAHQESYALEAAAVAAACYAAALAPGASLQSVTGTALRLAKDGTRAAMLAALGSTGKQASVGAFVESFWRAYLPYSGLPPGRHKDADADLSKRDGTQIELPSRIGSTEHLPAALAVLAWSGGDFIQALRTAVLLGRDCESVAALVCGLLGALGGAAIVPDGLRTASDRANRRDQRLTGQILAAVAREVIAKDKRRLTARLDAISAA